MHDQATRLRQLAERHSRMPAQRAFVVAVTSGKGGVGKSTVALNFAVLLRDLGLRVILFDADGNLAGLDVMFGVAPRFRLSDVLRGDRDLQEVMVSPISDLRLLPGSSGETNYPLLGVREQEQLMEDLLGLDEGCDVLVIDTAAGLTPEIIGYTEWANEIVVVTTPDPTAVVDAYAVAKVIWASRDNAHIHLLLNKVALPREGEEAAQKLEGAVRHFLKRQLSCLGPIPLDEAVMEALNAQRPLVHLHPHSGSALSLQAAAHHLMAQMQGAHGRRASV